MKVDIAARKGNGRAAYLTAETSETLARVDTGAVVNATTTEELGVEGTSVESFDDCDLVMSIDSGGTFLYATRGADGVPILGVNLGEVGFLNVVLPANAIDEVLAEVAVFREGG